MAERRLRILLADDHPLLLEGVRRLLEPEFEVVGAVLDGRKLLESAARLRPDLVITDISLSGGAGNDGIDGIEATRRLLAILPQTRVLILSIHDKASWVRAAFEAGACGYLTKSAAPDELEVAVRQVLGGHFFVSPAVTQAFVVAAVEGAALPPVEGPLTPRETDIVRLVGLGLGNKDIARQLGVSVTTVRTHLSKVYDKLKTVSRVELAILASHPQGATM